MVTSLKASHPDRIGGIDHTIYDRFLDGLPAWCGDTIRFQESIQTYHQAEKMATRMFHYHQLRDNDKGQSTSAGHSKRRIQATQQNQAQAQAKPQLQIAAPPPNLGGLPPEFMIIAPMPPMVNGQYMINGIPPPTESDMQYPIKPGREYGPRYLIKGNSGEYCKYHDSPFHSSASCKSPYTFCRMCEGLSHVWASCPRFLNEGGRIWPKAHPKSKGPTDRSAQDQGRWQPHYAPPGYPQPQPEPAAQPVAAASGPVSHPEPTGPSSTHQPLA